MGGARPNSAGCRGTQPTTQSRLLQAQARLTLFGIVGRPSRPIQDPLKNLSDCDAKPYVRFFLVRNEEAGGSNPLSSTRTFPLICRTSAFLRFPNCVFLNLPDGPNAGHLNGCSAKYWSRLANISFTPLCVFRSKAPTTAGTSLPSTGSSCE